MVQFKSLGAVTYSHSTVTMTQRLYCTIIFRVNVRYWPKVAIFFYTTLRHAGHADLGNAKLDSVSWVGRIPVDHTGPVFFRHIA